jgi:Skp family chaperone for outer membrane proteins|tara:strand:- start:8620 stop:9213 length:594 start_codon:yes stop_codon:yes gene_type:complete
LKKYIGIVAVVLVSHVGWSESQIAFVDMQDLFTRFYKTQLAQDQIRQQADEMKLEQDIMKNNIEEIRTEIEQLRADSRDAILSAEVRSNKRVLLEEKLIEMQGLEQEMNEYEKLRKQQIDEQNTRMTKKLFDEIQDQIVMYSKEEGFDAVIDRTAQSRIGINVIAYVDSSADITELVLKNLNEGYEQVVPMVGEEAQ